MAMKKAVEEFKAMTGRLTADGANIAPSSSRRGALRRDEVVA